MSDGTLHMPTSIVLAAALAIGLLAPFARAQAEEQTPEQMVARIYAQIMGDKFMGGADDPSSTTTAPAELSQQWLTDKFYAARTKDERCGGEDDEGVGNLWIDGQDVEIKNKPVISVVKKGDERQVVRAKFKNFDLEETVDYTFVKTVDGWRIDNIVRDGKDLYRAMSKTRCKK